MEKITRIEELKFGDKIVKIDDGKIDFYVFLAKHPHNEKFAFILDIFRDVATKIYIPLLFDENYFINYELEEVRDALIHYHREQINELSK